MTIGNYTFGKVTYFSFFYYGLRSKFSLQLKVIPIFSFLLWLSCKFYLCSKFSVQFCRHLFIYLCFTYKLSAPFHENFSSIALPNLCDGNSLIPAGIYLFKGNNRNTRTINEICSKLTIETPQGSQWRVLLTSKRCCTLLWCFQCWLWTNKFSTRIRPANCWTLH